MWGFGKFIGEEMLFKYMDLSSCWFGKGLKYRMVGKERDFGIF